MYQLLAQIPQPIWVLLLFGLMGGLAWIGYLFGLEVGQDYGFRAGYDLGKRNVEVKRVK
jgi:hypothetical protein